MARRLLLGICLGLLGGWHVLAQQQAAPPARESIVVAEIRGTINPASASFLESTIHQAEAKGAKLVLVELDTPGGLVSSVREMAQAVSASSVPVAVFVTPSGAAATSAGALLMLSAHVAAMSPGTNVGAAHPVGPKGEDVKGAMGEKVLNDVSAFARGLAEVRGRPVKVAEQFVKKSKSFTAKEALKLKVIDYVADSRAELLQKLHGHSFQFQNKKHVLAVEGSVIETIGMTWGQNLLHYLANPNIAAVLMTLAMLLIYVELSNPGIGIAGVGGAVCLLIAFMALQLLPIRVGGVALISLGMILMIAEPFVASGGALAAGGIVSFILGLLWVVDPAETDLAISPRVWIPAAIALGAGVTVIGVAAARMKKLARETLEKIGGGAGVSGLRGYKGRVETVAPDGRSGKVIFRGETWDFESDTQLAEGAEVEAIEMKGFHVRVKSSTKPN